MLYTKSDAADFDDWKQRFLMRRSPVKFDSFLHAFRYSTSTQKNELNEHPFLLISQKWVLFSFLIPKFEHQLLIQSSGCMVPTASDRPHGQLLFVFQSAFNVFQPVSNVQLFCEWWWVNFWFDLQHRISKTDAIHAGLATGGHSQRSNQISRANCFQGKLPNN